MGCFKGHHSWCFHSTVVFSLSLPFRVLVSYTGVDASAPEGSWLRDVNWQNIKHNKW